MVHLDKKGFTLAEVLLTLAIVGIIAALTVPSIMASTKEATLINTLKKNFSTLSEAATAIRGQNYGTMAGTLTSNNAFMNLFANEISFRQTCLPNEGVGECFHNGSSSWKNLHGGNAWENPNTHPRAVMSNGAMMYFQIWGGSNALPCTGTHYRPGGVGHSCGKIIMDINGFNPPNVFGRDIFEIHVNKYNVTLNGIPETSGGDWNAQCNPANTTYGWNGGGCAGRLFIEGKINY